jgi:hypothetical protein
MKDLKERKQTVKAGMYRKLWYCILISIFTIFGFFFFNSFTFAGVSDPNFVPNNWPTRWFVLDGWLNLVYFADVAFICYMWLPTANNRRFAMSDEVRLFLLLTPADSLTSHRLHKTMKALKSQISALRTQEMRILRLEELTGRNRVRTAPDMIHRLSQPQSQMYLEICHESH